MNEQHPGSAGQSAVTIDRRTGPADRRQSQRAGGRRSTDIMATGLLLSTMFVTGCAQGEKLSPLAPASLDSDVRPEVSAPASPRSFVASPVVSDGRRDDVDVESDTAAMSMSLPNRRRRRE